LSRKFKFRKRGEYDYTWISFATRRCVESIPNREVETHALLGIHLEILKGEYVSIAGPSGYGKSTLLSIRGLLDSPTGGSYWLNGKPVKE